ncbi:MAG: SpoIIE family protein phosphatase, partial [Planctomycetota bacterium]
DGLVEAMSPARELFGTDRVHAVIERTRQCSLEENIDALLDAAVAWQGSERLDDDLSILALEIPTEVSASD